MRPAIGKREPGAGDQVFRRARYEDLAGISRRLDARSDVEREAGDVMVAAFDLAGV